MTSGFAVGLDWFGSITGLRSSLVLRAPLTPTRDLGSQRPREHGSSLAPTPLRMGLSPSPARCGPCTVGRQWTDGARENAGSGCSTE